MPCIMHADISYFVKERITYSQSLWHLNGHASVYEYGVFRAVHTMLMYVALSLSEKFLFMLCLV